MNLIISSGKFKGRRIKAPPSPSTRPSSVKCRAALFNICQSKLEGSIFLDLYAGSGAIGIEALSRGVSFAFFIEANRSAFRCLKENIFHLGLQTQSKIIFADAFAALSRVSSPCDIVYIDPPYEYYKNESFMMALLSHMAKLKILNDSSLIFFEAPSTIDRSFIEKIRIPSISLLNIRSYGSSLLIEMEFVANL